MGFIFMRIRWLFEISLIFLVPAPSRIFSSYAQIAGPYALPIWQHLIVSLLLCSAKHGLRCLQPLLLQFPSSQVFLQTPRCWGHQWRHLHTLPWHGPYVEEASSYPTTFPQIPLSALSHQTPHPQDRLL